VATNEQIQQVWVMLIAAYPNYAKEQGAQQLTLTLKLYQTMLQDVPMDILHATTLQHIAAAKWFPTIAELRGLAASIQAPPARVAIEAWGDVLDAMAAPSYYRYADGFHEFPKFADPLVQRIVDSMGWGNLCGSEDGTADRARFLQAYDALARRAVDDRLQLPIVRDLTQRLAMQRSAGLLEAQHVG
jgi:hypothetical protein